MKEEACYDKQTTEMPLQYTVVGYGGGSQNTCELGLFMLCSTAHHHASIGGPSGLDI